MRTGIVAVASASVLAAVACGGSSTSPGTSPGAVDEKAQIASCQDLAQRVQSASLAYRATMNAPDMTVAPVARQPTTPTTRRCVRGPRRWPR